MIVKYKENPLHKEFEKMKGGENIIRFIDLPEGFSFFVLLTGKPGRHQG